MQPAPIDGEMRTLERIVQRYRRDVNILQPPATEAALEALEAHLGAPLPPGLRAFLARHNGASLLRGSLRIRSTAVVARAHDTAPSVVLFADGPGERWAYAPDTSGWVFGLWDGERLRPLHGSFAGWLRASLTVAESQVRREEDRCRLRFEADPNDIHQLLEAGRRALERGQPEEAEAILRRVTVNDPSRVLGWQYLGDALAITDRNAARRAWLDAFRRTVLPLPWPGAALFEPSGLRSLRKAFADSLSWEEELQRFLDERVQDVRSPEGVELVVAVGRALARSRLDRGRRSEARDTLAELVASCHGFAAQPRPWAAMLDLARLEFELGNHDEAEALVRRVVRGEQAPWVGQAWLLLAQIAATRQEPFVEGILEDAERAGLDEEHAVEWALVAGERAVRVGDREAAAKAVERAERGLERCRDRERARASVQLLRGDLARLEGDLERATALWSEGLERARRGTEIALRLRSRLGDAALQRGEHREAEAHYIAAARGFAAIELPLREAWVLLRLARLRSDGTKLLRAALERFKHADLAAGVAAHDELCGDPGLHLNWHLDRARDHARARYDAQRCRPPYRRSDADRPERRLGAHQLAIASCPETIVDALAQRMERALRAIEAGRVAPKDESVLHYVGSVDLLANHRSWQAAEVLLSHLTGARVDGYVRQVLQGAVARSPNTALVHGLLRFIEKPDGKLPSALASAAEVLGLRRERYAIAPLMALARRPHSPTVRRAAVEALGRIGAVEATDVVLESLEVPSLAETAALALLLLGDRRALDFHARALLEPSHVLTRIPGEILGRYGGPDHLLLLIAASENDGPDALGALHGLGLLGDPRGVPALLKALARPDTKVVEIAMGALALLTGHEVEEGPGFRARWHRWWEQHGPDFPEGIRFRYGERFGVRRLIRQLEHDDPWVRRTAYDELCITTGERFPFDVDGRWRVQQMHVRRWKAWWATANHRFEPGRWYLYGEAL